jgi:guanosine-3',5'-bis(diphosphate) 3'-pyrophosphohydrolase
MTDPLLQEVLEIAKKVKLQLPGFDQDIFIEAYEFARDAHEGQLRKDGSPYIIHPIATVEILSQLKVDEDTLIAALLHDVPEDTPRTVPEIEERFGARVAFLVEGITKLSKVHYQNDMESRQVESLKKLLVHTARDPRVIMIKLADRLHNMRTLHFVDKVEKRRRISRETLEIYVPMASLLGIQGIKSELEDLCFRYLYPDDFAHYSAIIATSDTRLKERSDETISRTLETLASHGVDAKIFQRRKTLFSIFRKVQSEHKTAEDLNDLITLRVIVPTSEDAYRSLGIIHTIFKPRPGSFKDYIAVPKINGYRSLHTTIFGIDGTLTEFQIRTSEMDNEAEYGITTYYFLGSKRKGSEKNSEEWRTKWMTQILELEQQEVDGRNFVEKVKADIFEDKIFVFTPKGDAIHLPKSATVIDFAYAIHSDVGNYAVSAEINGYNKPIFSPLKSGDTIHINIDRTNAGPQRDWLTFAKTTIAKNRIREFLNKESSRTKALVGKQLLQKAFYRAGLGLIDDVPFKQIQSALSKNHYQVYENIEQLLIAIGDGTLDAIDVIQSLFPDQKLTRITRSQSNFTKILNRISRVDDDERVTLSIAVHDRAGMVADILGVLSKLSVNVIDLNGSGKRLFSREGVVRVTFDLERYDTLQSIFAGLEKIDGVKRVARVFRMREASFGAFLFVAIGFWLVHPFLIEHLTHSTNTIVVYIGFLPLLVMSFYLARFTPRIFSSLQEGRSMIAATGSITIFALVTLVWEIYYYDVILNVATLSIITAVIFYLMYQFWDYKKKRLF